MKTKVLFVYPAMMMGGSTTSLLSILYSLNYEKYQVDVLLFRNIGSWINDLPEQVNLLSPCYKYQDNKQRIFHQILSPRFMKEKLVAKRIERKSGSYKLGQQYLEMKDVDFFINTEKTYDVAVAFLEGQSCKYVANHVCAKRKIGWIHIDYGASGFCPMYDVASMDNFDKIVTVSKECEKSYKKCFPMHVGRTVMVENILSAARLNAMAAKEDPDIFVNSQYLNLVTTCRISFASKGLDRAVSVIAQMKEDGVENFDRLRWYIIGDGGDLPALQRMIAEKNLSKTIITMGGKTNPYPYVKAMSLFFLPSYWEGKPMAVTEGQILGLPALVTNYTSAKEQVANGIDGLIVENAEKGIYEGLRFVLNHPDEVAQWRNEVRARDYSNQDEIKKVERLLDG